jgi:hypothetical protein
MELIQPTIRQASGKRLLLVDPYPRNNPYRFTASERRVGYEAAAYSEIER